VVDDTQAVEATGMHGSFAHRIVRRRIWLEGRPTKGLSRCLARLSELIRPTNLEPLEALLAAVDAKDSYTGSHSVQVAGYADAIARRIHLPISRRRALQTSALLHDIGKIGVPDRILNKPGPLTREETDIMRRHPRIAFDILSPIRILVSHRPIVLHHHERYDGQGYPGRLLGEAIPLESRILAIADAVDTMLSPRPYKLPYTIDQVRSELMFQSGRQFDPHLAGIALAWLDEAPDVLEKTPAVSA
jgi:HD-GYP domain-containing protein (c-di-GMP phosphodiesterase class II)